jgi:hypothetical protein
VLKAWIGWYQNWVHGHFCNCKPPAKPTFIVGEEQSIVFMGESCQPKPASSTASCTFLDGDSSFKWKERIIRCSCTAHRTRARFHFLVYRLRQLCVNHVFQPPRTELSQRLPLTPRACWKPTVSARSATMHCWNRASSGRDCSTRLGDREGSIVSGTRDHFQRSLRPAQARRR